MTSASAQTTSSLVPNGLELPDDPMPLGSGPLVTELQGSRMRRADFERLQERLNALREAFMYEFPFGDYLFSDLVLQVTLTVLVVLFALWFLLELFLFIGRLFVWCFYACSDRRKAFFRFLKNRRLKSQLWFNSRLGIRPEQVIPESSPVALADLSCTVLNESTIPGSSYFPAESLPKSVFSVSILEYDGTPFFVGMAFRYLNYCVLCSHELAYDVGKGVFRLSTERGHVDINRSNFAQTPFPDVSYVHLSDREWSMLGQISQVDAPPNPLTVREFGLVELYGFVNGKLVRSEGQYKVEDDVIYHKCSSKGGFSGSPIILRGPASSKKVVVIGIHQRGSNDKVYNEGFSFPLVALFLRHQSKMESSEDFFKRFITEHKSELRSLLEDRTSSKIYVGTDDVFVTVAGRTLCLSYEEAEELAECDYLKEQEEDERKIGGSDKHNMPSGHGEFNDNFESIPLLGQVQRASIASAVAITPEDASIQRYFKSGPKIAAIHLSPMSDDKDSNGMRKFFPDLSDDYGVPPITAEAEKKSLSVQLEFFNTHSIPRGDWDKWLARAELLLKKSKFSIPEDFLSDSHYDRVLSLVRDDPELRKKHPGASFARQGYTSNADVFNAVDVKEMVKNRVTALINASDLDSRYLSNPYRIFEKKEITKLAKLLEERYRLIFGGDLIDQLVDRLLYQEMLDNNIVQVDSLPNKVGLNFTQGGTNKLITQYGNQPKVKDWASFDCKSHDFTVSADESLFVADLNHRLAIGSPELKAAWRKLQIARETAAMWGSIALSDGSVWIKTVPGINPSGRLLTIDLNGKVVLLNDIRYEDSHGRFPQPRHFISMGDDTVKRLKETPQELVEFMRSIGHTYTIESEKGTFEQQNFCSREFFKLPSGYGYLPLNWNKNINNLIRQRRDLLVPTLRSYMAEYCCDEIKFSQLSAAMASLDKSQCVSQQVYQRIMLGLESAIRV